jgi:hypothetical protein
VLIQTAEENGLAVPLLHTGDINPKRALDGPAIGEAAMLYANEGREEAVQFAEQLRVLHPPETEAILARLRLVQRRPAEAAQHLRNALLPYRANPWPDLRLMQDALDSAVSVSSMDRSLAASMYALVERPFAGMMLEDDRKIARVLIAEQAAGCGAQTLASLAQLEPHVPFREEILALRARCYRTGPLAEEAQRDLERYRAKSFTHIIGASSSPTQ